MEIVFYDVKPGDTLTGIMKMVWNGINQAGRDLIIDELKNYYQGEKISFVFPDEQRALFLCLAQWIGNFNGKNWNLYDNKPSADITDPDTLKPGDVIKIPAPFAIEVVQDKNLMRCIVTRLGLQFQDNEQPVTPFPAETSSNKKNLLIGGGLLLLLLLLIKKEKK